MTGLRERKGGDRVLRSGGMVLLFHLLHSVTDSHDSQGAQDTVDDKPPEGFKPSGGSDSGLESA
jgi:hypothetical protein